VVRGIDWKWEEQDGGEGRLGLVYMHRYWRQKDASPGEIFDTVKVMWGSGGYNSYRLGADDAYDVLPAPDGVVRPLSVFLYTALVYGLTGRSRSGPLRWATSCGAGPTGSGPTRYCPLSLSLCLSLSVPLGMR
jgi:E3 ubiquitin-protein ligase mind-bomb